MPTQLPPIFNKDNKQVLEQATQQGGPQSSGQLGMLGQPLQKPMPQTPQQPVQRPQGPGIQGQKPPIPGQLGQAPAPQKPAGMPQIPAGLSQQLAGQPKPGGIAGQQPQPKAGGQNTNLKQVLSLIEKMISGGLLAQR